MEKYFAYALTSILLAGCSSISSVDIPDRPGHIRIAPPTSSVKIGHLYVKGNGARPAFYVGNQVYGEICPEDFLDIAALTNLEPYVSVVSTTQESTTGTIDGKAGVNATVLGAGIGLGANANQVYKVEKIKELAFSQAGVDFVSSHLEKGCKDIIRNREVFVLVGAQRADTVTATTTFGANASVSAAASVSVGGEGTEASASIKGPSITTQGSRNTVSVQNLVYFTARLELK